MSYISTFHVRQDLLNTLFTLWFGVKKNHGGLFEDFRVLHVGTITNQLFKTTYTLAELSRPLLSEPREKTKQFLNLKNLLFC